MFTHMIDFSPLHEKGPFSTNAKPQQRKDPASATPPCMVAFIITGSSSSRMNPPTTSVTPWQRPRVIRRQLEQWLEVARRQKPGQH